MNKKDKKNLILAYLVIAVAMILPTFWMHLPTTVDELGIFAHPALLAGHDWMEAIHSTGDYYYKYGTVLFYTLPYLLIHDTVILYRVLIAINGVLLATTACAAYAVCRRHLHVESETKALLFAIISTGAPAALIQSLYGRADYVMVLMPWMVLLCLMEANQSQKKASKILFSVLCALAAMYTFMSHTRGIVLVIALFLTILCARLFFRMRPVHVPSYLLATAAAALADRQLTAFFKVRFWGVYGPNHAAAEALNLSALKKIFTFTGFKILLKAIAGWCYTIFTSTLGVLIVGILAAVILLFLALRKREDIKDGEILAALLGLLNFMGSMALGILFFYPRIYQNFVGAYNRRADRIIYERYMVGTLGILCLIGLYALFSRKVLLGIKAKVLAVLIYLGTLAVFAVYIAPYMDRLAFDRKYVSALNMFRDVLKPASASLIGMGVFGLVLLIVWLLLSKWKKGLAALVLLLCAFSVIYGINCRVIKLRSDNSYYNKLEPVYELVSDLTEIAEDYPDIFVFNKAQQVKMYQPLLTEFNLINANVSRYTEIENMLVISGSALDDAGIWEGRLYQFEEIDYGTSRHDVVYVAGEELKDLLEEMGYALTEFETGQDA